MTHSRSRIPLTSGDLITSIIHGRIRVDDADPEVMIMKTLLDELEQETHPDVSLKDDVLEIRATNGTYRYRLDHWGWDRFNRNPGRVAYRIETEEP